MLILEAVHLKRQRKMAKKRKYQYNPISEREGSNLPPGYSGMTYEEKMEYWADKDISRSGTEEENLMLNPTQEKFVSGFGDKIDDEEGEETFSYAKYGKSKRKKRK